MLEHLDDSNRLTRNQYKIVLAGAVADMLNFYDYFMIGYVLAFILGSWRLSYGQSAFVLLASSLGALPGALVWGRWADRIGRQKILFATIVNFALASGAMALTPRQGWLFLTICQFILGFGFAGLHTVVIPLVQEFMPTRKRGWAGGMVVSGNSLASLLNAAGGAALAPLIGWRGLAALGVVPILAVILVRAWLPESPRWLARRGRSEEARRALAWALGRDPREIAPPPPLADAGRAAWHQLFRYPKSLLSSTLLQFFYQAGHQALLMWSTALLMMVLQIGPVDASAMMMVVVAAGLAGALVWSHLSEAIGRQKAGAVASFGAALALLGAAYFHDRFIGPMPVFWLLLIVQRLFGVGGQAVVQPYSAEVWPMSLRASGMGLAFAVSNLGRMMGILGLALVIGSSDFVTPHATRAAIGPALLLSVGWFALSGLVFVFFAFETKGRSIEEIDRTLRAQPLPALSSGRVPEPDSVKTL
jgi:putative MFS transporter